MEYGKPDGIWTWGTDKFPVKYVLERPSYKLYAGIDRTSNNPRAIFWADAKSGVRLHITGRGIQCLGSFRTVSEHDPVRKQFPDAAEGFTWIPGACPNRSDIDTLKGQFKIEIVSVDGAVWVEDLSFSVIESGVKYSIDSV